MLRGGVSVGTATADAAGNWSYTSGALADGAYSYTAQASDAAGNASAASAAFVVTVDTTLGGPPSSRPMSTDSGVSATDHITNDTTPALTGHGRANATVTVLLRRRLGGHGDRRRRRRLDLLSGALADSSYTYPAQSIDPAGNAGATSAAFVVTIDSAAAAPVISSMSADSGSSASDRITNDGTPDLEGHRRSRQRRHGAEWRRLGGQRHRRCGGRLELRHPGPGRRQLHLHRHPDRLGRQHQRRLQCLRGHGGHGHRECRP